MAGEPVGVVRGGSTPPPPQPVIAQESAIRTGAGHGPDANRWVAE
jgi:hypothetical protein